MFVGQAAEIMKDKQALVVGCGGLGGYVVEFLARLGLGKMVIADNDIYSADNINRQLFATNSTLGKPKVTVAQQRVLEINPSINCIASQIRVDTNNISQIAEGCDIVFDCCDNIETRLILERYCEKANIVLIHGAINDMFGQVSTIYPKDRTLSNLYKHSKTKSSLTLSYVPATVAALQVNEAVKVFIDRNLTLNGKLMIIDLIESTFEVVRIK